MISKVKEPALEHFKVELTLSRVLTITGSITVSVPEGTDFDSIEFYDAMDEASSRTDLNSWDLVNTDTTIDDWRVI